MSGGSMGYLYYKVIEYADDTYTKDPEITELLKDIAKVLRDMARCCNSDIGEPDYRKTVQHFKEKWFKTPREERLRGYIDNELSAVKTRLYHIIGEDCDSERSGK